VDSPAFYTLLFVHLCGLVLGFGSVLVTDLYGALWLVRRQPYRQVVAVSGVTEKFVWIGWSLMVAAGIPLLVIKGQVDNLMWIKLFFVALIGANGLALSRVQQRAGDFGPGDELPSRFVVWSALALFVSQIGWWGAMLIGFLHRHVQSVIQWPPAPWPVLAPVLLLLGLGALGLVARAITRWGLDDPSVSVDH
jgi:hypothetical protein